MATSAPITTTPDGSRRRDYVEVHDQLLTAAGELFAEGGPDGVTVSAVADRAEVSRATVHRHIGTRQRLLWEVTARLLADMGAEVTRPLDSGGLAESVERLIDTLVGDPDRARTALVELIGPTDPRRPLDRSSDGAQLLSREVAMMGILAGGGIGRPGIDPEVLAVINLAGMLMWSVLADRGAVSGGPERFRSEVVRLLLHGAIDQHALPGFGA